MISKTEAAREIVERYIDLALKNNTQYSKKFISSVLHSEHPSVFKDPEEARFYVRSVTGAAPKKSGQIKRHQDLARRFALIPAPIRELENPEPYIIPTSIKNSLIINDLHSLFYDRKCVEIAIDYGIKKGCDSVIINGDFMDYYGDSKFDKNPLVLSRIFEENEWGVEMLKLLQDIFGSVYLKEGNHDLRRQLHIERMAAHMPELMGMSSYKDSLFFDGCRVQFIEDYRLIEFGDLYIMHSHEFMGGAGGGIHVAHNKSMKARANIAFGHHHTGQSKIIRNIKGEANGSWSIACLCNLHPRYSPINPTWMNGFGRAEKDSTGNFEFDNRVIIGSKSYSI